MVAFKTGLGPGPTLDKFERFPYIRAFERVPKGALFRPGNLSDAAKRRSGPDKEFCVQVLVRDNNIDQALKALKKKMQREGIFREMKLRGHYEKPSEKRAREKAEAVRRARKLARKKLQREGLLPMKPKPVMGAR